MRRLHDRLLIVVAVVAAVGVLVARAGDVGQSLEQRTVDTRFAVRGERPQPKGLVIVAIDAATFADLGQTWPFKRSIHARVVDRLRRAGARVIAYDIQFTEPTVVAQDNALIEALRRAGNVVLAGTEVDGATSNVLGGPSAQKYARVSVGDAGFRPDPGGTLRHATAGEQGVASFAVATVRRAGLPAALARLRGGRAWIDFAGGAGRIARIPFSAVYEGTADARLLRGAIAVVGPVAPSLQDYHPTSTADVMSGVEIQANAIDTLRRGVPLRDAPDWLATLAVVLLAAGGAALGCWRRALGALGVSAALAGAYLVVVQVAFAHGHVLALIHPLAALMIATVGATGVRATTALIDRERTRDTLARFVSDDVASEVLRHADAGGVRLGGRRLEATVLFSDLRGFTAFAEQRDPEEVVTVLNRYLEQMSDAILDHGGTLVAYMGDGIMAVFGAPLERVDHADGAVAAAAAMLARMDDFNAWLRERGAGDGFKMGIGVNTGPVLSGNVGSQRRMEFTALGDTTNTAARLEGMTKGTPHQIFIADATRERLSDPPQDLELVDELDVRGRQAPVRVWTLTSHDIAVHEEATST